MFVNINKCVCTEGFSKSARVHLNQLPSLAKCLMSQYCVCIHGIELNLTFPHSPSNKNPTQYYIFIESLWIVKAMCYQDDNISKFIDFFIVCCWTVLLVDIWKKATQIIAMLKKREHRHDKYKFSCAFVELIIPYKIYIT